MTVHEDDWRDRAACLGVDPELFFPVGTGEQAERQIAEAIRICARCPVIEQCRNLAIRRGYEGVWGGQDDVARRQSRRPYLMRREVRTA